MDRHEDDPSRRVLAQDRGGGRDPVEARHRDVADDHVRRQLLGGADQRETVLHLRDDVELRLQQTAQQFRGFRRGRRRAAGAGEYMARSLESMPWSLWSVAVRAESGELRRSRPENYWDAGPKNY